MMFLQSTVGPQSKETASQKAKSSPQNRQWRPRRVVGVYMCSFFHLDDRWVWVVNATPLSLTPRKENRRPLYRRRGGPQGRSGRVRKISPAPWSDLRTASPNGGFRIQGIAASVSFRIYRVFMKWRFNSALRFHPWKVDAWFAISTCCSR